MWIADVSSAYGTINWRDYARELVELHENVKGHEKMLRMSWVEQTSDYIIKPLFMICAAYELVASFLLQVMLL